MPILYNLARLADCLYLTKHEDKNIAWRYTKSYSKIKIARSVDGQTRKRTVLFLDHPSTVKEYGISLIFKKKQTAKDPNRTTAAPYDAVDRQISS